MNTLEETLYKYIKDIISIESPLGGSLDVDVLKFKIMRNIYFSMGQAKTWEHEKDQKGSHIFSFSKMTDKNS